MSNTHEDIPPVIPVAQKPPSGPSLPEGKAMPSPQPGGSILASLFLATKVLLNLVVLVFGVILVIALAAALMRGSSASTRLTERHYAGESTAQNKIAIIKIDGVLIEGMTSFAEKQLEQAAADKDVKAVVLRINSPGGSITASEDLHRRIVELRDGNSDKNTTPKNVVVSMGGMAASGGYYISVPAETIYAEPGTITGSIGVIVGMLNLTGLEQKTGIRMDVITRGEVKDSGSMFRDMTPQDRQVWEDILDEYFSQFQRIVKEGRKDKLKADLREIIIERQIPDRDEKGKIKEKDGEVLKVKYERRLADGGIYTAQVAKQWGLIDRIGSLDDAIKAASTLAGVGSDYRVITYERPPTLMSLLTGGQIRFTNAPDMAQLSSGATPRVWYLAPQAELAGILASLAP